ncbi:MAG: GNAT family N-acetyltransferase [Roseiflexaceae bacterium]|nr:GNAT family N-acetyltransferase [Roseiflexaceae bacterium]
MTFTGRAYAGDSDLQAVTDLLNLVDAADKLDDNYSVEELRIEFDDPQIDPARDLQLWHNQDDQLIAFSQMSMRDRDEGEPVIDGFLYMRVHPEHRGLELEDAIFAWGEARLREAGRERGRAVELRSGGPQHYAYYFSILERHGLARVRYFFRMVRDLSTPIPELQLAEGYTLRTVASAEDEQRWVAAYNLSFIDHYNHHERTIESHRHMLSEPSYSRERDLIALAEDGTVAAFAFCWINPDDNLRNERLDGWVSMLGVARGHRKLGLGKGLLIAALHRLKADGMSNAKLGVDAENPTGALQLYESVGFVRDETWVQWMKGLRAEG